MGISNIYRRLWVACLALAMSSLAIANNIVVHFTNASNYLLFFSPDASDYNQACINATDSNCESILVPGASQTFAISHDNGVYVSYSYDSVSGGNHYGFYVQVQKGKLVFQSPNIPQTATTANDATNTITFQSTAPDSLVKQYAAIPFRGVNMSGAEAGGTMDGLWFWIPSYEDVAPYIPMGVNTVRLPIRWEYLTDNQIGPIYQTAITGLVNNLLVHRLNVIVDLHNYMRTFPLGQPTNGGADFSPVLPPQLAQVWILLSNNLKGLAQQYDGKATTNQLIFEIMNEPNQMNSLPDKGGDGSVLVNTNAAIAAIRATGITSLILIEGNSWSGLHSWMSRHAAGNLDQVANATLLTPVNIHDPANNWAIAVHQYFDKTGPYSGTGNECVPLAQLQQDLALQNFMQNYVNKYRIKVFLNEFGMPNAATNPQVCAEDMEYLLTQVMRYPYNAETGGFIGWTAWQVNHAYGGINQITPKIWRENYQPFTHD